MRYGLLFGCHQGMGSAEIERIRQVFRDFASKF